ncbi:trafficking protein particle complex 2, partial [Plasmodium cynomolgi strain B]
MSRNSVSGPATTYQVYVLTIIGKGDIPLYEADLSLNGKKDISEHLAQFIIHQSLDSVDVLVWKSTSFFLKTVDSFNNYSVSAYCTTGHIKFLLLHKSKNEVNSSGGSSSTGGPTIYVPSDENIRSFFEIVHENYIKVLLNPLYEPNGMITSSLFDQNVHLAAKRFLY